MASSEPLATRLLRGSYPALLATAAAATLASAHGLSALWIDGPLAAVAVLAGIAAGCTFQGGPRARAAARRCYGALFLLGVLVAIALLFAIGALYGAYGPFGKAGAGLAVVLLAALLPTLVVGPWLAGRALREEA